MIENCLHLVENKNIGTYYILLNLKLNGIDVVIPFLRNVMHLNFNSKIYQTVMSLGYFNCINRQRKFWKMIRTGEEFRRNKDRNLEIYIIFNQF